MKSSRRFPVSTVGLSPDLKRVDPAFGNVNRGDLSRQKLFDMLETFRQLETDWGPTALRIVVQGETGRFIVARAPGQQLSLTTEGEPQAKSIPVTTEQALARFEQTPTISIAPPLPPPEPMWRTTLGVVLLVAGVALVIHALNSVLAREGAQPAPDITLVDDPVDLKARQPVVVGVFTTGQQPGDRQLTISADGHIVFTELGARQSLGSGTDTYRIGRRDRHTLLVTAQSGTIEAINYNTLVYYGDSYRRIN